MEIPELTAEELEEQIRHDDDLLLLEQESDADWETTGLAILAML